VDCLLIDEDREGGRSAVHAGARELLVRFQRFRESSMTTHIDLEDPETDGTLAALF